VIEVHTVISLYLPEHESDYHLIIGIDIDQLVVQALLSLYKTITV